MDQALKQMLTQTISVRSPESYAADGSEVLSAAVTMLAYIEHQRILTPLGSGQDLKLKTLIISEDEITRDMLVYLPGVDASSKDSGVRPDKVISYYDLLGGVSHYETVL